MKERLIMFKRILSVILSLTLLVQFAMPVFAVKGNNGKGHSDYIKKYSDGSDYDSVKSEFNG